MTATVTATCETCRAPAVRPLRHSDRHGFDVGRCSSCGMVYVLDPPSPAEVEALYAEPAREVRYAARLRDDADAQEQVLDELARRLPGRGDLFDVGAGTGEFLERAAEAGWWARGNDLSASTAAYARGRGVDVSTVPLAEVPTRSTDALTMWCVLAHVPDPKAFLAQAWSALRPDGVLFLRTPRWCAIDTAGTALSRVGWDAVADRRVNQRHLHIYGEESLAVALEGAGFVPEEVAPVCHYGFSAAAYLETMGWRPWGAGMIDSVIDHGYFVRNTLFAYARKP